MDMGCGAASTAVGQRIDGRKTKEMVEGVTHAQLTQAEGLVPKKKRFSSTAFD